MNLRITFSVASGILEISAYIPYLISLVTKKTKPAWVSWFIWGILDSIILAGMVISHTVNGQIIADAVGCWVIFLFTIRNKDSHWTKIDVFCLAGAFLGIALWLIFNNPVLGIVVSLMVLFIGYVPTFISAWKDSRNENKLTWSIFWLAGICAVLSVSVFDFAGASQPIVFLSTTSIMLCILYLKPWLFGKSSK